MNFSKAEEIVAQAVKDNATRLNLVSVSDSEKLCDADLVKLLPELLKLKNLQWLDISYNNFTEFNEEFAKLKKLEHLYIRACNLTKFDKEFAKLGNLQKLDLTDNKLTKFDKEFAKMQSLQELLLGENELVTFDKEFAKLKNLQKLTLFGNPLPFPVEILKHFDQPQKILNFIIEYYEAQEKGNLRPLNEAKLVVVGEANVGKTCVINRLIHDKFSKTDSTHGIEIYRWKDVKLADEQKVQLNVWDFGGQEIMHSTHQFFFTKRTVYILVINARENQENNKTEEWLQRIKNLSQNSPVFIVGNKIDENNRNKNGTSIGYFDIDRKNLMDKFPELIKGFYGISSDVNQKEYDYLFQQFKKGLISEIGKLEEIHKQFPESWFDIKAQLEEMRANKIPYITFQDYLRRCVKADIENEQSQRTLIEFMHDLGIALSFQNDKELRDLAVLNPEWVTSGVYALVDNTQIAIDKGILKREMIGSYLNEKEYPPRNEKDFIIKMMRKFKLLIDVEKDKIFLIPDLLPKDEPDTGNWDNALHFQYSYEIYEKSILRSFIVEMYPLRFEETYWRNGIVLTKGLNRALVKADVLRKYITVKVKGSPNTRREFLAIIRREFDKIHGKFDSLNVKEKVGHPKYPEILRDYNRLLKMEDNGIDAEFIEEFEISLPVKDWLDGVESADERKRKSKDMENNKYKFAEHLTIRAENVNLTQQEQGKIEINQINADKDFEKIIDNVSTNMHASQVREMEKLAGKILSRIEKSEIAKLNEEEKAEFENVRKEGWETKLKFVIPLIPKIPFLENILPNASFESLRIITADECISTIRKKLYGEDMQLNILQEKPNNLK